METNRKIVIVDDDPQDVELAATTVALDGWQSITAETGAQAFDRIAGEKPWLLIVGETLTDMAGRTLLRRLLREVDAQDHPGVIMLVPSPIGGGGLENWSESERYLPPDMYLGKPFNALELRSFVNRLYEWRLTHEPRTFAF